MACDGGAVLKVVELILCIVCLVYKRYTDNEAIRVFYHLEKISREWPLLNNITWNENGALLADVTFGGFAIITLGLLLGQVCGELRRARRLTCFFLVLGCIMFLVVGGLCLAAVDQVPDHLVDNAIILGVLSILTGILFLVDIAVTGNKKSSPASSSSSDSLPQEKKPIKMVSTAKVVEEKPEQKKEKTKEGDGDKSKKSIGNGVLKELRSSFRKKKPADDVDGKAVNSQKNEKNVEFETDRESIANSDTFRKQESSSPENGRKQKTFEDLDGRKVVVKKDDRDFDFEKLQKSSDDTRQFGRRRMDNRGFSRTASDDSGRFSSDRFRNDFVDAERDRRFDRDFDRFDSRNVNVIEGVYDGKRSRPPSMMEVELDEHYLRPKDYYIEKKPSKEDRRLQDHNVSSSRQDFSDEEYHNQLPSVSYLLSERGKKVLPGLSTSPVERLDQVTSSTPIRPRYYYNSRDPASGSSAPPSPRTPGYVLHTASQWEDKPPPHSVTERMQHWFRGRQQGKAP